MITNILQSKLETLPHAPGVYIFKDAGGKVIYIGKAASLKKRVSSYFRESEGMTGPKHAALVSQIVDLEYILCANELESLILESNMVKHQRPRYNVILRDDKHYPYIKLTMNEKYPRAFMVRRIRDDRAAYFGPYSPASTVWQTLNLICKVFKLCCLKKNIDQGLKRPCLNYQMGRCLGPCVGAISPEDYRQQALRVKMFLEGKDQELYRLLQLQMKETSENLQFERAAQLRDQLAALTTLWEKQRAAGPELHDQDVVGLAVARGQAQVQVYLVRQGKILSRDNFSFRGLEKDQAVFLGSFLKQYYQRPFRPPKEIILPLVPEDGGLIGQWLSGKRGQKVELLVPARGRRANLLEMAGLNAQEVLTKQGLIDKKNAEERAWKELESHLDSLPRRLEAYDISNIMGQYAVGSMVVWERGAFKGSQYRHYRIKTVEGADDYAMLIEVLSRRFSRAQREHTLTPALVLIDGGKGQLGAALKVQRELNLKEQRFIALAKEQEEVFMPGKRNPLKLPADSEARKLLQRVRDEAHRFAVRYHQKLRSKGFSWSWLTEIPGIGEKRKKELLRSFGGMDALRAAKIEELKKVLPARVAEVLQKRLKAS